MYTCQSQLPNSSHHHPLFLLEPRARFYISQSNWIDQFGNWFAFLLFSQACSFAIETYLVLLHFEDTTSAVFTNWRLVATLHWASLSSVIFPTAFALFLSLCHILVVLTIFQTFSLLWCFMVICDQWSLMLLLSLFWRPTNCIPARWWT